MGRIMPGPGVVCIYDENSPWEARFKRERLQGKKLHILNAADLLNWNPTPRKWNLKNLIPLPSLVMLAAYAKVGKSTFVNLLIISILQGKRFLGFQTRKSPVLLLAVEENERDVCDRLKKFGLKPEDHLSVHSGFCKNDPQTLKELKALIKEKGIEIIFIDTLSMFWKVENENDNAEITGELGPLLALRDELRCSVVLIHHDNKAQNEGLRNMRGGSALAGIIDQGLMLKPGKNKNQRILKIEGRFNDYCQSELTIELRNNEYVVVESKAKERKAEDQKAAIFEFLKLNKDQTVKQMVEGKLGSDGKIRKILMELVDEKKVSESPRKKKGGGNAYNIL